MNKIYQCILKFFNDDLFQGGIEYIGYEDIGNIWDFFEGFYDVVW